MRGAYEMTGLLEAQYGPYEALTRRPGMGGWWDEVWGDKPAAPPVQAATPGVGEAVARVTCLASGGTWDEAQKTCLGKAGEPVDPLAALCASSGLVWDAVKKTCLPPGSTPTPPPEEEKKEGFGVGAYVAIGVIALGGIYLLTRKKRARPNMQRSVRRQSELMHARQDYRFWARQEHRLTRDEYAQKMQAERRVRDLEAAIARQGTQRARPNMQRKSMNIRQAMLDRVKAKTFWHGLRDADRAEIGDQLVLGTFDWRDWFPSKPSAAFMNELDRQRILWEVETS